MMGNSFLISDLSNSKVYPAGFGKKTEKPGKIKVSWFGGAQSLLNPNSGVQIAALAASGEAR